MLRIESKTSSGTVVEIGFVIQTRLQNSVQLKDTVCFGVMQQPADGYGEVTAFKPAIAYQSAKDNFSKVRGKKIALTRFLERNGIERTARSEVWEAFNKKFK